MPKKRRSDGKGNVIPHKVTEHHKWKCPVKGCRAKGEVYSKQDVDVAIAFHVLALHGK